MKRMITTLILCIEIFVLFAKIEGKNVSNFICSDGTQIPFQNVCDGVQNCLDATDEASHLCYHVICPPNTFRCYYGACISKTVRCDGKTQCTDGSDEYYCTKEQRKCASNSFQCISGECIDVNKLCNGVDDCSDKSDESTIACEPILCPENTYRCKCGGCINLNSCCDGYPDCIDNSDESDVLCKTLKCSGSDCQKIYENISCPPILSTRINVKCQSTSDYKKGWLSCNQPLPIGTVAEYQCRPFYKPVNDYHLNNTHSVCQADGTWSREHVKCEPECGVISSVATPLIVHGWTVKEGAWPWHATLYSLQSGIWTFWCGGSLISEKAVLTAAHCTWRMTVNTIKVALGKVQKEFNESQEFTQIINVKEMIMQPLYQDILGNYGSDIAILILNQSVEFSSYIVPVCIDWNLNYISEHLKESSIGMVAGMGVTENDTFSDEMRITHLPVASDEKCIESQTRDFKKYITYTSFCAGWGNGTGVCNGDSGGGLIFPKSSTNYQWVLQGIVSVSPRRLGTSFCDPKHYTIFTKVGMFVKWIKDVLGKNDFEETYDKESTKNIIL